MVDLVSTRVQTESQEGTTSILNLGRRILTQEVQLTPVRVAGEVLDLEVELEAMVDAVAMGVAEVVVPAAP